MGPFPKGRYFIMGIFLFLFSSTTLTTIKGRSSIGDVLVLGGVSSAICIAGAYLETLKV